MKHDRTNFIATSLTNPLTILFKQTFNITRVSEKNLHHFPRKLVLISFKLYVTPETILKPSPACLQNMF